MRLKSVRFFSIFSRRDRGRFTALRGTSERRFIATSAEEETTTARERSASQFRSVIMPRSLSEGAEGTSNDDVSSAGRSSSRVRAPSLRALESRGSAPMLADELASSRRRQPPPASADRFRRTDRAAQQSECDFSDKQSVNRCYPTHKGRGRHDVPQSLIDRCHSVAAKARAVREWRVLTSEQQKERKKALAAEKKKQKADAKAAKASTKRKRQQKSDEEKTADLAAKQARDRERKKAARQKEKIEVSTYIVRENGRT